MFQHTQSQNGRYATRCLFCFRTLMEDAESEEVLARSEANHLCPERALKEMQDQSASPTEQSAGSRLN